MAVPLVGRASELEQLLQALNDARRGAGGVTLICGDPGVGKTHLVRAVAERARADGDFVAWGRAHETDDAPACWPWIQALRDTEQSVVRSRTGGGIVTDGGPLHYFLAGHDDTSGSLTLPADARSTRFHLFDAIVRFLRETSERRTLLLVLEDAHWADVTSLELLGHIALELADARLLIIVTYRPVDAYAKHPLRDSLAELGRAERFQLIELGGLSTEAVREYLQHAGAGHLFEQVGEAICEATGGNPFFLREIIPVMLQGGQPAGAIPLPPTVRSAIGSRLEMLSRSCRDVLDIAAVAGREFSLGILELVSSRSAAEVSMLIHEAMASRLVEPDGESGSWRFHHALIRDAILADLSPGRRLALFAAVASAEDDLTKRYLVAPARLAYHFREAASASPWHAERAVYYNYAAGERAEVITAWSEAVQHYSWCRSLLARVDGSPVDEAELLTRLGRCVLNVGKMREAWRHLMQAISLFQERGDVQGVARATLYACRIPAPPERHRLLLTSALGGVEGSGSELEAELLACLAQADGVDLERRKKAARRAAEIVKRGQRPHVAAHLLLAQARQLRDDSLSASKFNPRVVRRFLAAHEALHANGAYEAALEALTKGAGAYLMMWGHLDEAEAIEERAIAYRRVVHIVYEEMNPDVTLGSIAWLRADFSRAERISRRLGRSNFFYHLFPLARAELEGNLKRLAAGIPDPELSAGVPRHAAILRAVRARIFLALGDHRRAREEVEALVDVAGAMTPAEGNAAIAGSGPVIAAIGDDRFVERMYETALDTGLVWSGAFGATVYRGRGDLALALHRVEEARSHFSAGAEWAAAQRCPLEEAYCERGLARLAQYQDDRATVLHHARRAVALFQEHDVNSALPELNDLIATAVYRRDTSSYPAGLTRREVEVLRLVAQGKTNAWIARELYISANTVANHLRNIRAKTATANRTEAATYANRVGLIT